MTENSNLISALKTCLPENSWSWAIPALIHDPVILVTLNDPQFLQEAIEQLSKPEDWNPTRLALLKLNRSEIEDIDNALVLESEAMIEGFLKGDKPFPHQQMDLQQAAYISIGLIERYKISGWNGVQEVIESASNTPEGWLTPFAVILGLVPDQIEFIHSFYQSNLHHGFGAQLVHAVLCQPVPPEILYELIHRTVDSLPIENANQILNILNNYHPRLSQKLAADWIENHVPVPQEKTANTARLYLQQITDTPTST